MNFFDFDFLQGNKGTFNLPDFYFLLFFNFYKELNLGLFIEKHFE